MRALPTVTLQACEHAGKPCWKAFFPFYNPGIRAVLEQYGLYYDEVIRTPLLPLKRDDIENLRTALQEEAFLYVRQGPPGVRPDSRQGDSRQMERSPVSKPAAPFSPSPPSLDDLPSNSVRACLLPAPEPEHIPVQASSVIYHGEERIRLLLPPGEETNPLVQQINGSRWSPAMNAWHLPKTTEAWEQAKQAFPGVEVIKPASPYEYPPVFCEMPPAANAPAIRAIPVQPSVQVPRHHPVPAANASLPAAPNCLRIEPENRYRMKAFVPAHRKDWIEKVKNIPDRAWNKIEEYWSLPLAKPIIQQLSKMFGADLRLSPELPTDMPGHYVPKYGKVKAPEMEAPIVTQTTQPSVLIAPTPVDDMVIARYATGIEDRVFLQVPWHRKDWKDLIKKAIPDLVWRDADRVWEIRKTQENFDRIKKFLKNDLVLDKKTPFLVSSYPAASPGQQQTPVNGNTDKAPYLINRPDIKPIFESYEEDGALKKKVTGDTLIVRELNHDWLAAYVPYDKKEWLQQVKTIRGKFWEGAEVYWRLPYSLETLNILRRSFAGHLALAFTPSENIPERVFIPPGKNAPQKPKPTLFEQLNHKQKAAVSALETLLTLEWKAYETKKSYRNAFIQFIHFFPDTLPSQISDMQIREYFLKRIKTDEISRSTQSTCYSALQAFYIRVMETPDKLKYVERPDKEEHLPKDLKKEEVERLIKLTDNIKHKCLFAIMYSGGLRVGELVKLRVEDIDIAAKSTFVFQSKNNKDRFTLLGNKTIPIFLKYLDEHKPQHWLFESQDGSGHYSVRSVQEVFSQAMARAGIRKNLSTHSLRHSFATHNSAKGMDLERLQMLMGHKSIKTTQIYLHMTKDRVLETPSPIDDLDI